MTGTCAHLLYQPAHDSVSMRARKSRKSVRFRAFDMLVATNRNTAGSGYAQLKAALERLAGTRISTNIVTGGQEVFRTFGLIESAEVVRETRDGRMQEVEVKLSDWVFNAIRSKEVLTLHRDYFRLRKPLERRIYEIARKHCGAQKEWRISLSLLQKKCGSNSTLREFRRLVMNIIREDQSARPHARLLDYVGRAGRHDSFSRTGRTSKIVLPQADGTAA
jgi:plasmid replication initiation protein